MTSEENETCKVPVMSWGNGVETVIANVTCLPAGNGSGVTATTGVGGRRMDVMSAWVSFAELRSPLVAAVTVWMTEGAPLLSTATIKVNAVDEAGSKIAAVEHDSVSPPEPPRGRTAFQSVRLSV